MPNPLINALGQPLASQGFLYGTAVFPFMATHQLWIVTDLKTKQGGGKEDKVTQQSK